MINLVIIHSISFLVTKQVDANWQGYYKGRTLTADLDSFFGKSSDNMIGGLFE